MMNCFFYFLLAILLFPNNLLSHWQHQQGNGLSAFEQDEWNRHDPTGLATAVFLDPIYEYFESLKELEKKYPFDVKRGDSDIRSGVRVKMMTYKKMGNHQIGVDEVTVQPFIALLTEETFYQARKKMTCEGYLKSQSMNHHDYYYRAERDKLDTGYDYEALKFHELVHIEQHQAVIQYVVEQFDRSVQKKFSYPSQQERDFVFNRFFGPMATDPRYISVGLGVFQTLLIESLKETFPSKDGMMPGEFQAVEKERKEFLDKKYQHCLEEKK